MPNRFKILVADDDPDVSDLIASILSADDYEVLTAFDGDEAITVAARENPDAIIIDLNMPKSDGLEVIHALRGREATRETPVIVLTANNDEGSAAKGFAGGADDFLVKPFAPAHLRARVTTWLLRRRDQESTRSQ